MICLVLLRIQGFEMYALETCFVSCILGGYGQLTVFLSRQTHILLVRRDPFFQLTVSGVPRV